jgi:hypothetical protein
MLVSATLSSGRGLFNLHKESGEKETRRGRKQGTGRRCTLILLPIYHKSITRPATFPHAGQPFHLCCRTWNIGMLTLREHSRTKGAMFCKFSNPIGILSVLNIS